MGRERPRARSPRPGAMPAGSTPPTIVHAAILSTTLHGCRTSIARLSCFAASSGVIARPVPVPYTAACPASCAHFTMMNAALARSLPTPPPLAAGSATPATYRIESHDCRDTSSVLGKRSLLGSLWGLCTRRRRELTPSQLERASEAARLRGGTPQPAVTAAPTRPLLPHLRETRGAGPPCLPYTAAAPRGRSPSRPRSDTSPGGRRACGRRRGRSR